MDGLGRVFPGIFVKNHNSAVRSLLHHAAVVVCLFPPFLCFKVSDLQARECIKGSQSTPLPEP